MDSHVGIFWILGRKVIAFREPAANVPPVNGVADSDLAHDPMWTAIQREHRQLRDKEYWQIPRGRVVHHVQRDRFVVYCPTQMSEDAELIARIRRKVSLPPDRTDVLPDLHYDPPSDDLLDDDD